MLSERGVVGVDGELEVGAGSAAVGWVAVSAGCVEDCRDTGGV